MISLRDSAGKSVENPASALFFYPVNHQRKRKLVRDIATVLQKGLSLSSECRACFQFPAQLPSGTEIRKAEPLGEEASLRPLSRGRWAEQYDRGNSHRATTRSLVFDPGHDRDENEDSRKGPEIDERSTVGGRTRALYASPSTPDLTLTQETIIVTLKQMCFRLS